MPRHRPRIEGQALVLAVALLLAGSVALFVFFNASQVTAEKQRLTNAADAAAYSVGAFVARVMNYEAYSNRAIVANEIQVAQAIALAGYAKYLQTLADNAKTASEAFPVFYPYAEGIDDAAAVVADTAEYVMKLELGLRAQADYGYKNLLRSSQKVMKSLTTSLPMNSVATEVVRATNRRYFAWVLNAPRSMIKDYETQDERQLFADLIRASLPDFAGKPRHSDMPDIACAPIEKRGTTQLSADLERWESADTLSIHVRKFGFFGGCKEILPVGWGGSEATDNGLTDNIQTSAANINDNGNAKRLIDRSTMAQSESYSGVTGFADLDFSRLDNEKFPTSRFVALVRMDAAEIKTASTERMAGGRMLQTEQMSGDRLFAMSAAELYFKRPNSAPRDDGTVETASLFNPYWQVRLAKVSAAERALAWLRAE